jgi:hypothetical protein
MNNQNREMQERIEALEQEVAELRATGPSPQYVPRGVRKRSESVYFGMPLWEVATGPDPDRGEIRGHARAIFAVGDIATGVFALGGIARGVVCLGGITLGCFTLGGVSMSLIFALGGVAIAPVAVGGAAIGGIAMGGAAIGGVAIGNAGVGYYAKGAAAAGRFVISAFRQDPEAVRFFAQWFPWL